MVHARLSTTDDVRYLAENLRPADLAELEALGMGPLQALRSGLEYSEPCWTILSEHYPVAMFGVVSTNNPEVGCIWLLGSEELTKGPTLRKFLRQAPKYIDLLHTRWPILGNWIDQRNVVHQRWLQWLGFKFLQVSPAGPFGLPFVLFERRSKCATQ